MTAPYLADVLQAYAPELKLPFPEARHQRGVVSGVRSQ